MQHLKDGKYPTVHVDIDGRALKGTIYYGAWNALAVELTDPIPGGCVRWKIDEPCDGEWLCDESGQFTEYANRFATELLIALYNDALRMGKRLDDIKKAMSTVAAEEGVMAAATQAFAIKVVEALPGPELEVDPPTFCSTYQRWLEHGLFDSSDVVAAIRERVSNLVETVAGLDPEPQAAALADLARIVQCLPRNYGYRDKYALALSLAGQKKAAFAQAERLAKDVPNCSWAHRNLGVVFLRSGDPSRACNHFEYAKILAESDSDRQELDQMIELLGRTHASG